jgi:hypothetical protein
MIDILGRLKKAKAVVAVAAASACLIASVGLLASPASAASAALTVNCPAGSNCTVTGNGFTPGGQARVQDFVGTALVSSFTETASPSTLVCFGSNPRVCRSVGGGGFSITLLPDPNLACGASAAGTVQATDIKTGSSASAAVTLVGPCPTPTTTTLTIPPRVDTGFVLVSPARVTANSGTVDIMVKILSSPGPPTFFCSYTVGAGAGCDRAGLPAGNDLVQAFYLGSGYPSDFVASSASETVTVLQSQGFVDVKSFNWAGFVDTGETYTSVSGSWTVPHGNCQASGDWGSASSSWVGLDGGVTSSPTVEQIGTNTACVALGEQTAAWWEAYPYPEVPIFNAVYPGDVMQASVTATGAPGAFLLAISDTSQRWTFSTTVPNIASPNFGSFGAKGASAEWITEQPEDGNFPLTNFGSVTFTNCLATGNNGLAAPIWDHPNLRETMTDPSFAFIKAFPSALTADGTQFTDTWAHN